jgi:hypothetical protein
MLSPDSLFMPVSDSAFRQVVWGQLNGNPVAIHRFDPMTAESPCHHPQHLLASVQFNRKHSSPEFLDNLPD